MNDIVIIWDFDTTNHKALEKAEAFIASAQSTITIKAFINTATPSEFNDKATLHSHISKTLAQFPSLTNSTIDVIESSDITSTIVRHTQEKSSALVIKMGNRSERAFYTPTDWQLIRQLTVPLLLLTQHKWKAKPVVLATVDAQSKDAKQQKMNIKVLQNADLWSKLTQSQLHCAYVLNIAEPLKELAIIEPDELMAKKGTEALEKTNAICKQANIDITQVHIRAGNPAKSIPSIANKIKADILVMGSVGRKGIKHILLGNTAEKTIKNLRTDLLVIKP